jgi:hypothetical protein
MKNQLENEAKKFDLNAKRPDTTYSEEYIKDRARVDQLAKNIQNQILQLNKQLTATQITDFSFKLLPPGDHKKPIPKAKKFYIKLIKFLAWFGIKFKNATKQEKAKQKR